MDSLEPMLLQDLDQHTDEILIGAGYALEELPEVIHIRKQRAICGDQAIANFNYTGVEFNCRDLSRDRNFRKKAEKYMPNELPRTGKKQC